MAQGFLISRTLAGATTNATLVSALPRTVSGWHLYNAAAYAVFLKLYDSATIPTAGAGTPVITLGIPAASSNVMQFGRGPEAGIAFLNGLGFTMTKLQADNDTTVLVAGDLVANLFFN